jgi:uncharacterized protein with HEPN domain
MHKFIIDKCELIEESIRNIEFYTQNIFEANDFNKNNESIGKLDATMMRLQVIGENIKKIIKIAPDFFSNDLQFDTNAIIRFRDFISHHYEKLDTDIIFEICQEDIPLLKQKIQTFLSNNNETV